MRTFVTGLTAVMLLAHAALGCCAHHEHACGAVHGSVAVGGAQHHGSSSCCTHSAGNGGQTGHEHHGQDQCEGFPCDFVRPPTDRYSESRDLSCPPVALSSSCVVPALIGGQREQNLGWTGILPPLRRHLVHQVLLI